MISSKEAETMDYRTYKKIYWQRSLAKWNVYKQDHPERQEFVAARIAFAEQNLFLANWRGIFA